MSSRIRSRSLCSRLSRQGFPCSWCGLGAVLLFVMAYPPVAETSSEEIPVLFSTTSQEHTPFTFLQESGQNPVGAARWILYCDHRNFPAGDVLEIFRQDRCDLSLLSHHRSGHKTQQNKHYLSGPHNSPFARRPKPREPICANLPI